MKRKNSNFKNEQAPLLDQEGCPPKVDGVVDANARLKDFIHSLPHLNTFRTDLRNRLTPAEAFLWKQLQHSQLDNKKFRRQHSIGNYIVDFYCAEERLAIELDGEGHYNEVAQQYDMERDLFISYYNVRILRFENNQVFDNLEEVLREIRECFGK